MKNVLLIAVFCIGAYSCSNPSKSKEIENLAIAKKYMNAVETKNVTVMDSLLASNYIGYGPSVGDSANKEQALQSWKFNAENLYESFEYTRHKELAVSVDTGEVKGDWVLNWAYLTIKYKDGRGPINLWVNAVYRIEDGKIVHSRTFYNEADALNQLGFTMAPPTGE